MINTHTHLYDPVFDEDRQAVVQRAIDAGLTSLLMPNCDLETLPLLLNVEKEFPVCKAMMGLHPTSVKEDYQFVLDKIGEQLFSRSFVAVGEIGLDYYWDTSFAVQQKTVLEKQLQWALELDLPVAIHCRNAFEDIFELVRKYDAKGLKGVFHCFLEGENAWHQVRTLQCMKIGVNGVVTFKKNQALRDLLETFVPLEQILLETDDPYLAPTPFRGKRNEPAFVVKVAEALAEIYKCDIKEVAEVTTMTAKMIFD